jgi:hypothetical protein
MRKHFRALFLLFGFTTALLFAGWLELKDMVEGAKTVIENAECDNSRVNELLDLGYDETQLKRVCGENPND